MPERNLGPVSAIHGVPFPPELISYTAAENWHPIRTRLLAAHVAVNDSCCGCCNYESGITEELRRACFDLNKQYFQGKAILSFTSDGCILLLTDNVSNQPPRLTATLAAPGTIAVLPLGTLQYPPIHQQQQFPPQQQQPQYQFPPQQQQIMYPPVQVQSSSQPSQYFTPQQQYQSQQSFHSPSNQYQPTPVYQYPSQSNQFPLQYQQQYQQPPQQQPPQYQPQYHQQYQQPPQQQQYQQQPPLVQAIILDVSY